MRRLRDWLQHRLNALHVYCRLKDCGLSEERALRVSRAWERLAKWLGLPITAAVLVAALSWSATARAETVIQAGWCQQGEETRPCLRIVQDGPDGEKRVLYVPLSGSEETDDAR